MSRYMLFILISFATTSVFAQPFQQSISVSGGISMPVGDYANTSANNNLAGYAQTGQAVQISYNHSLDNQFNLMIKLHGQRNPINTNMLAKNLIAHSNIPEWKFEDQNYYFGALMVGISKSLSLSQNNHWYFSPGVSLGLAYTQSPSLKAESKLPNDYALMTQSKANAFGAAMSANGQFSYAISKNVHLLLNLEYFTTSKITFKEVKNEFGVTNGGLIVPGVYDLSNSKNPPNYSNSVSDQKMRFNGINILLGVQFKL